MASKTSLAPGRGRLLSYPLRLELSDERDTPLSPMGYPVSPQMGDIHVSLWTHVARVRAFASVDPAVAFQ